MNITDREGKAEVDNVKYLGSTLQKTGVVDKREGMMVQIQRSKFEYCATEMHV